MFKLFITLNLICILSLGLSYPRNKRELEQVEALFNGLPEDVDDSTVLKVFEDKYKIMLAESKEAPTEEVRHSAEILANLLKQHIDTADINEEKCTVEHASDLIFLIDFHMTDEDHRLLKYLQHNTIKQFDLCKPKWDDNFKEKIDELGDGVKQRMEGLLDNMMSILDKNVWPAPSRPYKREFLRKLVARPIESAILLNIIRNGGFSYIDTDENLKNPSYPIDKFKRVYEHFIVSLCRQVCQKLEPAAEVYRYAFDKVLERQRPLVEPNDYIIEWLASKSICCTITKSHGNNSKDTIMENTFRELTSESEFLDDHDTSIEVALFDLF